jgi:hypothetical protein
MEIPLGTVLSMQSAPIATSCKNRTIEVVFSVGSVLRIYHQDQQDNPVSFVVRQTSACEDMSQGTK